MIEGHPRGFNPDSFRSHAFSGGERTDQESSRTMDGEIAPYVTFSALPHELTGALRERGEREGTSFSDTLYDVLRPEVERVLTATPEDQRALLSEISERMNSFRLSDAEERILRASPLRSSLVQHAKIPDHLMQSLFQVCHLMDTTVDHAVEGLVAQSFDIKRESAE